MKKIDLSKSPIRRNVAGLEEGQLSIFEDGNVNHTEKQTVIPAREILQDVENMMGAMEGRSDEKVRIAVMGEVKAGKSTFINVLSGKEVAFTNVREATAVVAEIAYAKEESVRLLDAPGHIAKTFSIPEMLEWMGEMVKKKADFSPYEKMEIGVDSEVFQRMTLVDTPGLLSITPRNHDVTNRYVAETDYILWVLNSRNLGSKAVNDYLDGLKLSGKPIIGIINKVDSEEERREVEEYVRKEYGAIFDDMFFISAKQAWELQRSGEEDWQEETGFEDMMEYLADLAQDRGQSESRTQRSQLHRDLEVHRIMREKIKERKQCYDDELAMLRMVNSNIKDTIHQEIRHWCEHEFFVDEKNQLLCADSGSFPSLLSQYSDSAYLTDIIERKYNEMASFIYHKWDVVVRSHDVKSSNVYIDFTYDSTYAQEMKEGENTYLASVESRSEGLKKGAVVGVAFAGYWAWLGPAAATATFAGSLVPCVIPFAIAGLVLAGKDNASKYAENETRKRAEVEKLYAEVVKLGNREARQMEKSLIACADHYYEERCREYSETMAQVHFDFTDPAFSDFLSDLDAYIRMLDDAIASLEQELPLPPTENETE